jgi:uncharacterized RDD family membrane protein YckC
MSMAFEPDDVEFCDDEEDWGPGPEPPAGTVRIVVQNGAADPYLLRSAARLLVGGAAEGSKLFFQRLEAWNAKTENLGSEIYYEAPDESRAERIRYTILGLAAAGTEIGQGALAGTAAASASAYRVVSGLMSPLTGSRLARPIARRYNVLAARGEAALERWVDAGRTAEQRSRALARHAYDEGSTEVIQVAIAQLAEEPAVRDLVTQQSTGMAFEIRDELRRRAAQADGRFALRRAAPTGADHLRPAGFVSRLLALVLDIIAVTAGAVVLGLVISLITNFFGLGAEQLNADSGGEIVQLVRTLTVALSTLSVALFVPLYFVGFWTLTGTTPGKRVLGLGIVHKGQLTMSWPRALLRYIGYFLSALPLFLGYFWVLGDRRRRGWHDKLANTQVVYTWDLPRSQ